MSSNRALERFLELTASLQSEWIKMASRCSGDNGRWSRRRAMPLEDILMCTLAHKGLSTVMELRQYFQAVEKVEKTVSKQNYLRQRQKLNPEVFKLLNRNYLRNFYAGEEARGWHGYLVMAVDGSRAEIPNSEENRRVYGESINKYGKAVARTNVSTLYDVLNGFTLRTLVRDIGAWHYRDSEIEEAKAHIHELKEIAGGRDVLLMFDRNYASLEFMDYLEERGIKYLIRAHKGNYEAEVSGMSRQDEYVEIEHTRSRMYHLQQKSAQRAQALARKGRTRVRIIKGVFSGGEPAVLLTNLESGTGRSIRQLYRKRWSIEKQYHSLKNKLKFESITGKASIYVEQDFRAQILVYNMVQDLKTSAEKHAQKQTRKQGFRYAMKINENIAIGLFKEQFIRLMLETDDERKDQLLRRLKADMEKNLVPVRKLKSAPRKWKYFNKYKCNLKPSF